MEQAFGIIQSEIGQSEVVYKKVRSKRNVYGKNQMDGQVSNDLSVFCINTLFRTNYAPFAMFCNVLCTVSQCYAKWLQ